MELIDCVVNCQNYDDFQTNYNIKDAGPELLLWNSYIYFNIFDRDVCGQNVHKSVKRTNLYIMRL